MSDPSEMGRSAVSRSWRLERVSGDARTLHAADRASSQRQAVVCETTTVAVVLGSTQPETDVVDRCGFDVVRRRSGGGAVWLEPGDPLWVEIVVPAGDPWWRDDVGRAAVQVGERWRDALEALGVGAAVHRGGFEPGLLGRLVCFSGLGPGEVVGDHGGKLVGIAQRRSRSAAVFQCAVYRRWDPDRLGRAVGVDPLALAEAGQGTNRDHDLMVGALIEALNA